MIQEDEIEYLQAKMDRDPRQTTEADLAKAKKTEADFEETIKKINELSRRLNDLENEPQTSKSAAIKSKEMVVPDTESDEEKERKMEAGGKEEGKKADSEINFDKILIELRRALSTEDSRFSSRDRSQVSFICDVADEKEKLSERLQKVVNDELIIFAYVLEYGWAKTLAYLRSFKSANVRQDWRKAKTKNEQLQALKEMAKHEGKLSFLANGLPVLDKLVYEQKSSHQGWKDYRSNRGGGYGRGGTWNKQYRTPKPKKEEEESE